MKFQYLAIVLSLFTGVAHAATQYELSITNGSNMPISPAVIAVQNRASSETLIGQTASTGLVQLCQTGNGAQRLNEIKGEMSVTYTTQTMGLLFPGQTTTVKVEVQNPMTQDLHFEAMYGKTKDSCAVANIAFAPDVLKKDEVVSTGAFANAVLPADLNQACSDAKDAVSCLRELSTPATDKIHYFTSYLPSVVNFLEAKYGAADTQTLIIPTSGGLQLHLKQVH